MRPFAPTTFAMIASAFLLAGPRAPAQSWSGYGRDPQHRAISSVQSHAPQEIRWATPVDLAPPYDGNGNLLIHYGSPIITGRNTVLVTVKTTAAGAFRIEARRGVDGGLLYTLPTDYTIPPSNWFPSLGSTLTPKDAKLVVPAAGGTVLVKAFPDKGLGAVTRVAFFGIDNYNASKAEFDASIKICTPITSDRLGNLYFGYVSDGAVLPGYPNGIRSGLARISNTGVGTFIAAGDAANDQAMLKVSYGCAPALTNDNASVYVSVNNRSFGNQGSGVGYLLKLNSTTLAHQARVRLKDVTTPATDARLSDNGTSSPTVGPDGDVYYGVLEANFPANHARGWMLHFSGDLATSKTPGAFGWDDTASIVPRDLVPSYTGGSSYLILTKYNNYGGFAGGDGINKLAILDPNATMTDPISGSTVMKEVFTIAGPTPDPNVPGGVREWCINTAAIDPITRSAIVNCEDGILYRWDLTNNTLSASVLLAPPTGEAYTPTVIGPDGAVYAINNAVLNCCVSGP